MTSWVGWQVDADTCVIAETRHGDDDLGAATAERVAAGRCVLGPPLAAVDVALWSAVLAAVRGHGVLGVPEKMDVVTGPDGRHAVLSHHYEGLDLVASGPMEVADAAAVVHACGKVAVFANHRGIVHGFITPGAMCRGPYRGRERRYLAGFMGEAAHAVPPSRFAAPELGDASVRLDERTDVFGLAMSLRVLTAGHEMPPSLRELVKRGMQRDRAARPSLATFLDELSAGIEPVVPPAGPPLQICPTCRARRVFRNWTGTTEGGGTTYDYDETCAACGWNRRGDTKEPPSWWFVEPASTDRPELARPLTVNASFPRRPERPLTSSLAAYVAWYLDRHVFDVAEVTFANHLRTLHLELSAVTLARAAASLAPQLAVASSARGKVGGREHAVLEALSRGGYRSARLLARMPVGTDGEQLITADDVLVDAVAAMWRDYAAKVGKVMDAWKQPIVGAAFSAVTAGLFEEPTQESLPEIFAEIAALADGAEDDLLWRGPRPDWELPPHERDGWWLQELGNRDDAFHLRLRPDHVSLLSRKDGRIAHFDESFDPRRPAGVAARLRFAWQHRSTFADGLALSAHGLRAAKKLRLLAGRGLVLVPDDGDLAAIVVEPRAEVSLGRVEGNDVVIPARLVSREQAILHMRDDGWAIVDAGSSGGTFVGGERTASPTALHQGDRLRLDGFQATVWQLP